MKFKHIEIPTTRRQFLCRSGGGFGAVALASLLRKESFGEECTVKLPGQAKRVIFLFMEGGPSHIDLFDPKPLVNELAGQSLPESFGDVITSMGESRSPILPCKRKWKQHGEGGIWISDWLPHLARHADDIAVIRSCWADGINHSAGVCQMNTCSILGGRPSLGSWVSYGLGTENEDMPAYVVMQDNRSSVVNGPRNWGAGFMPASYQGIRIQEGNDPIPNLNPPEGVSQDQQISKLAYLSKLNQGFATQFPTQSELDARIKSYELGFRMQAEAPNVIDLSRESAATRKLYGLDEKDTADFGKLCLMARRMSESGVRFIQLYHGAGSKWDAHSGIEANHTSLCKQMDWPVAGLLTDLKQRGLLDETLVIWGGEFGRTPMSEQGNGRDHNPTGFTMWLAGGGVRGGQMIGTTDELGLRAVENRIHVHDLHASILNLLGIDHMALTYLHKGRPERPTVNEGHFVEQLIG
jgi:hypothetical protein